MLMLIHHRRARMLVCLVSMLRRPTVVAIDDPNRVRVVLVVVLRRCLQLTGISLARGGRH